MLFMLVLLILVFHLCFVFYRPEAKDFKALLHKAVKKISTVRQVAQLTQADEGNVMIHHH